MKTEQLLQELTDNLQQQLRYLSDTPRVLKFVLEERISSSDKPNIVFGLIMLNGKIMFLEEYQPKIDEDIEIVKEVVATRLLRSIFSHALIGEFKSQ
jgi:hypothetical protein